MPMRRFWLLSRNADRVRAEEQSTSLMIAVSSQAGESAKQLHGDLIKQMGRVIHYDVETSTISHPKHRRDPDAGLKLKALAGR